MSDLSKDSDVGILSYGYCYRFEVLENMIVKLTDYGTRDDKGEEAIDEMYGVAVVFDEDEDNNEQIHEVQVHFVCATCIV